MRHKWKFRIKKIKFYDYYNTLEQAKRSQEWSKINQPDLSKKFGKIESGEFKEKSIYL